MGARESNRTYAGECRFLSARGFEQALFLSLFLLTCSCTQQGLTNLRVAEKVQLPATETIKITNYCPAKFVDFFAHPMSYKIGKDYTVDPDSNADGLSDVEAVALGVNPTNQPASGITDYLAVEYLGIAPTALATIPRCGNKVQATAGDALTDCQRRLLGLKVNTYDTPGRGFPDSLAVFAGLSPADKNVANQELAGDGMNTLEKIRQNLPVNMTITSAAQQLAVQVTTDTVVNTSSANSICYSFTVVAPRLELGGGDTYIFYFIGIDDTGNTSLVTKTITVAPNAPPVQEFAYASL